jgi:hypothetical protein
VMPGTNGMSQVAASVEVGGDGPQLSDDTGGWLWDLVKCGPGIVVLRSAASGDAAPAPGSLGNAGPGLSRLHRPRSLIVGEAESMCS